MTKLCCRGKHVWQRALEKELNEIRCQPTISQIGKVRGKRCKDTGHEKENPASENAGWGGELLLF